MSAGCPEEVLVEVGVEVRLRCLLKGRRIGYWRVIRSGMAG